MWIYGLAFSLALKQRFGITQKWPFLEESLLLKNRLLAATQGQRSGKSTKILISGQELKKFIFELKNLVNFFHFLFIDSF